jgi:hypothetical protein
LAAAYKQLLAVERGWRDQKTILAALDLPEPPNTSTSHPASTPPTSTPPTSTPPTSSPTDKPARITGVV